jgi:hypothetical protein
MSACADSISDGFRYGVRMREKVRHTSTPLLRMVSLKIASHHCNQIRACDEFISGYEWVHGCRAASRFAYTKDLARR